MPTVKRWLLLILFLSLITIGPLFVLEVKVLGDSKYLRSEPPPLPPEFKNMFFSYEWEIKLNSKLEGYKYLSNPLPETQFKKPDYDEDPKKRKYLAYVPSDGFGNQMLSLIHAIYLAWLTRRVVIVPPILDHFEAPARGNCYDTSVPGFTSQYEIIEGYREIFRNKLESGTYIPLTKILNLTKVTEFVEFIDEKEFFSMMNQNEIDIHITPYDCCTCQDTVWVPLPSQIKELKVGNSTARYRTVKRFLNPRNETLLQFGSIFIPSNAVNTFYIPFERTYKELFDTAASIPYVNTIIKFGVEVKNKIYVQNGNFGCVHIRITESYFKEAKESSMETALRDLKRFPRRPNQKPTILLLTDAEGEEKQQVIGNFSTQYQVKQISEHFVEEMEKAKKELGFDLDILHFEVMACVCAQIFAGNPLSTFSKRVLGLRKLRC